MKHVLIPVPPIDWSQVRIEPPGPMTLLRAYGAPDPRDRIIWQERDLPWFDDWIVRHPDTGEVERYAPQLERWAFGIACQYAKEWVA